jgi:hypothetical protein
VRVYDDVEAPVGRRSGSVFWSCTPTAQATPVDSVIQDAAALMYGDPSG